MSEQESISNKEKIVLTAHDLFLEKGYMNTSVNNIQEKAGISKGLIYYHFENKDELALAVLKYVFDQEFAAFDALSNEITEISDRTKLVEYIDKYFHELFITTMQERATIQIIIDLLLNLNSEESKNQVRELYEGFLDKIAKMLEYIGVDHPKINAKLILSLLDGLMYLNMALGKTLTEDENQVIINSLKCIIKLEGAQ